MRILVILKYHYLGDTLVSLPLIKSVRRQWPEAHLTLLTSHPARSVLMLDQELGGCTVLAYGPKTTRKRTIGDSMRLTFEALRYAWRERRRGGFDLVFSVHRSWRLCLAAWLARGTKRIGFVQPGGFLLTHRVPFDPSRQESESTLELLRVLAPDDQGSPWPNRPELHPDGSCPPRPPGFPPPGDGPLVGLQPGASSASRRWPVERMAALADALIERHGARIVLIGGAEERESADGLVRLMKHPVACDITGETLPETVAVMTQLKAYVGNDTGLNHLAAATGCPTVCLFGPTNAEKWGRQSARHRVIVSPDGTMDGIPLESALTAAGELLRETAGAE
jgi:heptosyltransferase-2